MDHETKTTSWLNPLKIEEMRARAPDSSKHERTEDGEEDYWVDYVAGTVTVPRKTNIPWYGGEAEGAKLGKSGE